LQLLRPKFTLPDSPGRGAVNHCRACGKRLPLVRQQFSVNIP